MHEKLLHMSHILFAEIIHPLADCLLVESVDERKDVLLECLGRKKGCCFRLHDMHHLEPQLLPRQRSRKGGVPGGDRFRLDLAAFRIRAANNDARRDNSPPGGVITPSKSLLHICQQNYKNEGRGNFPPPCFYVLRRCLVNAGSQVAACSSCGLASGFSPLVSRATA